MYVQLVQIMDRKIQKDQKNPSATSEATSEKPEAKAHAPCSSLIPGPTLPSPHIRNKLRPKSKQEH